MRVVIADPPAYTPPYDHDLAAALAAAGAEVELVTSRFRFGARPTPVGYTLDEGFYPVSARVPWNPARLALKGLEHPVGMRRLLRRRCDVLHIQWLSSPGLDVRLLHPRGPAVFTAHDILPRRTAHRAGMWEAIFSRFARVIVHSERGKERLVAFGLPEAQVAVIPHPVFRSSPTRQDDGRTVLALGVIRPYKGLDDTIAALTRIPDARLLVAGDPRIPLDALRAAAGPTAEWRLGYLGPPEIEDALSRATVAVFAYREELDQSGALLQALGAGVPAVVYDVGGLGEVVRRYDAGAVVEPGDVDALAGALARLLDDPAALATARAGAARARDELTWEASAQAHLAVYRAVS
ncbi:MAG: glycosyltransferase family 4 protein [Gaiellales bacterium]